MTRLTALLLLPLVAGVVDCVPRVHRVVADLRECESPKPPPPPTSPNAARDLPDIPRGDVLRVAMPPDTTSFYMANTRFAGFEHDIIRSFAIKKKLRLELHSVRSAADRIQGLKDGDYDLVAGRLDAPEDPDLLTVKLAEVPRVLIQRPTASSLRGPVESIDDLQDRFVLGVDGTGDLPAVLDSVDAVPDYLPDGLLFEEALEYLQPGDVMVGRADLAEHAAKKHDLEIGPSIPRPAEIELAMHAHAETLWSELNQWVDGHTDRVRHLKTRYLDKPSKWRPRRAISAYDGLFKRNAKGFGRPWTVLAAVGWQESRFHPDAESVSGARGVMQLMEFTAADLEVTDRDDPAQSISGGARYLRKQDNFWRPIIEDESERLNFVLASYNAGRGHVEDARDLAIHHGFDGNIWANVAPWIRRLKYPKWYRHPVVRYGGCRGDEPVEYVRAIRQRLELYDTMLAANR